MNGWEKVAAATVVAVIGLVALNLAIWRRLRAAARGPAQVHRGTLSTSSIQQSRDKEK